MGMKRPDEFRADTVQMVLTRGLSTQAGGV